MTMLLLLAGLLPMSLAAAQDRAQSPLQGVIDGTVTAQDGTPAKGLTLNAMPLRVPLGMILPRTKTNEAGAYQFQRLPLGRYTVYAEDTKAGYSILSTGMGNPGHPQEVELTPEHPAAEFNLHLPPPAGFLLFHLANRSTGAPISGIEVTVTLDGPSPRTIFSGSFSSSEPLLVPSDQDLLVHVTSRGFLEWKESIGTGRSIKIAPGKRLTLAVQLELSNPLQKRFPSADPKKYQGITDSRNWRKLYLIVRADGIEVAGVTDRKGLVSVDAVTAVLQASPDSAWPNGLVVAIHDKKLAVSESEQLRVETNRDLLLNRLGELGIIVGFWPSE